MADFPTLYYEPLNPNRNLISLLRSVTVDLIIIRKTTLRVLLCSVGYKSNFAGCRHKTVKNKATISAILTVSTSVVSTLSKYTVTTKLIS